MMRRFLTCAILGGAGLTAQAAVVDTMDTAVNFDAGFGGATATANGDGTVTLLRNSTGAEAGITWYGDTRVALTPDQNWLEIVPTATVGGEQGGYQLFLLAFDASHQYITEQMVGGNRYTADPVTIASVSTLLPANTAEYSVRFRLIDWHLDHAGVTLDRISAVPEPTGFAMATMLVLPALARRRRRD